MQPYYADNFVTIYHADCRDVRADLLTGWHEMSTMVTDPPYGIAYSSNRCDSAWRQKQIANDGDISLRDWAIEAWNGPALVFGSWKRPRPANTRAVLIWDKGGAVGMGDLKLPWKPNWEEIYVIGDGFRGPRGSGVLHYASLGRSTKRSWSDTVRVHPNEKPLGLMVDLISKCPDGGILDPFMGSGATLRAAKDLGRRAIGVEIEERFCEIAAQRCSQDVLGFAA